MGLSKTSEHARELRKAMEAAGKTFNKGDHAHHLVPSTHPYKSAKDARAILENYKVNINSHVNRVALGKKVHAPLHTEVYMDEVLTILRAAQSNKDVLAALKQIENLINAGRMPH